jgi:hypothetical protein
LQRITKTFSVRIVSDTNDQVIILDSTVDINFWEVLTHKTQETIFKYHLAKAKKELKAIN